MLFRSSEIAVAVVDRQGQEVLDLRTEWLPRAIYGEAEYDRRVLEVRRRRYYGRDSKDKAGILRYTKVTDALIDLTDIPTPQTERELAWLLSFYWHVDQASDSLPQLAGHQHEGRRPMPHLLRELRRVYEAALGEGLQLPSDSRKALRDLGILGSR